MVLPEVLAVIERQLFALLDPPLRSKPYSRREQVDPDLRVLSRAAAAAVVEHSRPPTQVLVLGVDRHDERVVFVTNVQNVLGALREGREDVAGAEADAVLKSREMLAVVDAELGNKGGGKGEGEGEGKEAVFSTEAQRRRCTSERRRNHSLSLSPGYYKQAARTTVQPLSLPLIFSPV